MSLHTVYIHPDHFECSCGAFESKPTEGEVARSATAHADENRPSALKDIRQCSELCRAEARYRNPSFPLHHQSCTNVSKEP